MTKYIQDRETGEDVLVVEAGKSHSWEVLTSDGKLHKVPLTDDMLTLIIKEYNGVINTEQDVILFYECAEKLPWEEKWWLKHENCISDNIIDMTMLDGKITSKIEDYTQCQRCGTFVTGSHLSGIKKGFCDRCGSQQTEAEN